MNYFAGLDVSLELTNVYVVDGEGGIVRMLFGAEI